MYWFSTKSMLVFYEVVRSQSFTRAAELLFMTQPGVSIHIARLEQELGVRLIIRKEREFEVTEEGKALFRTAEKIHKISIEIERLLVDFRGGHHMHLTIGATPTYCKYKIPEVIATFIKLYPDAQIKVVSGNSEILEKKLLSMELDIAIAPSYKPSSHIWGKPFETEDLMLITSKAHELASKEPVSLHEIKNCPIALREEGSATRKIILSAFNSLKISPLIGIEVNNTEFIKEWVSKNRGISIVSKSAASHDERISAIPLKEKLKMQIYVLCLKGRRHEMPIRKFIHHIN